MMFNEGWEKHPRIPFSVGFRRRQFYFSCRLPNFKMFRFSICAAVMSEDDEGR